MAGILEQERAAEKAEAKETKTKRESKGTSTEAPSALGSKRTPKADFVKMTITVSPEDFDRLEDISRSRRRARRQPGFEKVPFTLSDLIREALAVWFPTAK